MVDSFDSQTYRSFMKLCRIPGLPIVFLTIHDFFLMEGFQTRDESHRKLKEGRERENKKERLTKIDHHHVYSLFAKNCHQ